MRPHCCTRGQQILLLRGQTNFQQMNSYPTWVEVVPNLKWYKYLKVMNCEHNTIFYWGTLSELGNILEVGCMACTLIWIPENKGWCISSCRLTGVAPVRQKEPMDVHFPLGVNTDFVKAIMVSIATSMQGGNSWWTNMQKLVSWSKT